MHDSMYRVAQVTKVHPHILPTCLDQARELWVLLLHDLQRFGHYFCFVIISCRWWAELLCNLLLIQRTSLC